jgi:hypothetical protein
VPGRLGAAIAPDPQAGSAKNEKPSRARAACAAIRFAYASVIAVSEAAGLNRYGEERSLPQIDLFPKLVAAQDGRGDERWRRRNGLYGNARGLGETAEGLRRDCGDHARWIIAWAAHASAASSPFIFTRCPI